MKSASSSKTTSKGLKPVETPRHPKEFRNLLRLYDVTDWDYVIVGDGSGSTWKRAAGWGALVFDRQQPGHDVFVGNVNRGTNNFAELMPYVQTLLYLADCEDRRHRAGQPRRFAKVVIFTDSSYCAGGDKTTLKGTHIALWAGIHAMKRAGLVLTWKLVPRATDDFNRLCDVLSKSQRRIAESVSE